ncbi:elongation factor P maturation arginine rhamnosyltransferase EarP [Pseudomonas sp. 10B1]|uniref:elongation factor P maturation arginine rhamnosyltransferase EarP n=1 Tax=unclassified Pseudomonas TaxID=196821 RepID=UPI002B2267E3|nr:MULTISPECIES: elongation factor P maturation arginine rhamnosyltransferase EarP [unclassified Pseudomonas]MEA9978503.1 elongation factor P maturation arginine rhamnosyltransferase EarP [Pseudomonas sp. RTS4]MEA9996772.1 elongation factor P maturation arginine rhamnosyltransferase EarP [Pseudomonas sp. AA4]MEB0088875.1 elongation factor P maturation arginine rhamnosyltransferase EarP [Pseudomonas sp. RTI1]MEB0128258.1 elongation factor P maturation arginine rhamnosyltransferase EarP [Pseudomo
MRASWDIFCSVVDNYGDIGVTWRLARQLAAEHGFAVRLWVDDLQPFTRLCPGADTAAAQQWQDGVSICHWSKDWQPTEVADVVIEAFACRLPPAYFDAMPQRSRPPLWLNLEYLSAEEWVSGCHALPSPQPNGLRKIFFFPGFRSDTGGLLREAGLLDRRDAFQLDAAARYGFLQGLGVEPVSNARLISLFAYENSGLASWLDALATDIRPTCLLVPEGRIVGDIGRWLDVDGLRAGARAQRGALTVQILPFVGQDDYDRLLWSCDFNAVRGEDSFVRAQWAGRPLLWHIYEQDDDAHWVKLDAFLELYLKGLSPSASQALKSVWQAWNSANEMGPHWSELLLHWPEVTEHAEHWCLEQASQADLTAALVQFYVNWL